MLAPGDRGVGVSKFELLGDNAAPSGSYPAIDPKPS